MPSRYDAGDSRMSKSIAPRGLVLGKFLPPHEGHRHLVQTALAQVDDLTILVCSLPHEEIPGERRCAWMRALFPSATVVHVTDENPPEPHPERCEAFWEIWTKTVRRAASPLPDVLFTSEDYGDELAARLGMRHVPVDRERRAFPVSGTAVRAAPAHHLHLVPEIVRPTLVKRVVLTGPESTGKTVLAERLARHFGTVWVPEFAREYLLRDPSREAVCDEVDIEPIARGQIAAEETGAARASRVLICDTDLGVTKIYAEHYFGRCEEWIRDAARERPYDLHLLLDIDLPWVPDRLRDQPHARESFRETFRRELRAQGRRVVEVSGDAETRLARAVAAIERVLVEPLGPWTARARP